MQVDLTFPEHSLHVLKKSHPHATTKYSKQIYNKVCKKSPNYATEEAIV